LLGQCKQLVDLHRGWIECDSTVGVGTVFTVKLPRHPFSHHTTPQIPKRPTQSSHPLGRIVLVDNNDESGHFMSDMLTAAGYQLVWMLEGLTAISQLEMLQPAVVIINEQLIDHDAGTANIVKILRQNPITKRAKIMVLAHYPLSIEDQGRNGMGIDLVLSHPIQPEELLHKVGMLMATTHSNLSV
ncbi:MAG: hybrid sensor histidine kinase/response regulator, partial [Merismopedia sp. SIO2A8]|nr:hybrid sensor histidine kinase/response regulator [Merismopedia sp. SIO2A8]